MNRINRITRLNLAPVITVAALLIAAWALHDASRIRAKYYENIRIERQCTSSGGDWFCACTGMRK